ncbi:MAG: DUF4062 domain-containing protein [Chloroflexi bacterium]|nr:DUF4062 domain-containing protein [Chloroflexota bacterium]
MKIFISSTFEDLKEHREAVRDTILRLGHQPVEMEDFGSRPEVWNQAALNAINGCDALVGIYAHRYGSIPKGDTLSITEQEFDKAQALHIPCFCYRVDPNHPWLPKFVDSGDAKQKLDAFMKKVDNLLRSQFTTPENLANQVSADLGRELRETIPTFAFRAGSAPPLPTLIIGRDNVIADLKSRLGVAATGKPAAVQVLTAIRGWPGVGKTTIAAALAHDPDIAKTFPDGILWVSLGTKPNLLSELASWGRALGTDDLLRAKSVEEASAQLTAMLRNKKMLLVVDDVWESEHARAFQVGGRDCAMLITTRQNDIAQALVSNPNDIFKLPVLSDTDALELLKILAPTVVAKYPNESLDLIHDLEGLPLAIQVAGHLLNAEASYGFGVTDLLKELR